QLRCGLHERVAEYLLQDQRTGQGAEAKVRHANNDIHGDFVERLRLVQDLRLQGDLGRFHFGIAAEVDAVRGNPAQTGAEVEQVQGALLLRFVETERESLGALDGGERAR